MHGDFSRWFGKIPKNQVGILAQEGRILLDADVNAHALLGARWQDFAARAAFGAHIAAIPADTPDAWKVVGAGLSQGTVKLQVMPGPAWADGLLVELEGDPYKGVTLLATPLTAPIQTPPQDLGAAGTRDAVILEVWRRSLNGYQSPADLIEPALGGPDTAERIETAYALRLYRMADGDTCRSLDLNDKLSGHGHLTVTIAPTTMTAGDCPVVQGGGYTGLEHDLYRVEIADTVTGAASFKWSQWNGGLVGRGTYDGTAKKLTLHSGDQAILRSGLTAFYLEALVFDTAAGHWRVQYGVPATFDTNGDIDLSQAAAFGAPPDPGMVTNPSDPSDKSWFVRIWNELRPVSDFPAGGAKELRDGIRLEFSGTTFVPGDYWTFPVRAQLDNPPTLLSDAPPFGVHHHRVPLAELHWSGQGATIEDCRVPLHPITATDGCCTHSVGDGVTSHGDYTSIQAAIDALPGTGGRVCVLPGEYTENVKVLGRTNIEIIGCGPRSRVIAKPPIGETAPTLPAIYVLDTSGITIEKLHVEAHPFGTAILLEEDAAAGQVGYEANMPSTPFLEDIRIADCEVVAHGGSGIEIRGGHRSEIVHNHVSSPNQASNWALITVRTTEARIERNVVAVDHDPKEEYSALGGIWLRGGCNLVDVIDNEILRGAGHGVMLGHVEQSQIASANGIAALKIRPGLNLGYVINELTAVDCIGCGPGTVTFPPPNPGTPPFVAGEALIDIRICDNDIAEMGISGIGVIGFFGNPTLGVIQTDRLSIIGNRLISNIMRGTAKVGDAQDQASGYGAISLAEATELTILDNEIRDNGTRTSGQVCGIYVAHGSGVEVSRNRIYNNGFAQGDVAAVLPHGGIWLSGLYPPGDEGVAAAMVHENEIDSPIGPGLVMDGLGFYSITSNVITTRSSYGVLGKATAHNVSIVNNSVARDFNWASYAGLRDRALELAEPAIKLTVAGKTVPLKNIAEADLAAGKLTVHLPINPAAIYQTPPGAVIFANNTVLTDALDGGTLSAVNIQSLTDVNVSGNHFATFQKSGIFVHPTPVVVSGACVHVQNNRLVDQSWLASMQTIGYTNITTNNTADHCIYIKGTAATVAAPNIERFHGLCKVFGPALVNLGYVLGELKS